MINNVYMVALKGAFIQPEATIQGVEDAPGSTLTGSGRPRQVLRNKVCRPAGIWQFTGDGETNRSGQHVGSESIHLGKLICINDLTEFWPRDVRRDLRYVIISPPYFVATAFKGASAIMSYSFGGVFSSPRGVIHGASDLKEIEKSKYIYLDDFEIIVESLADGVPQSTKYNWICQVEVGLLNQANI